MKNIYNLALPLAYAKKTLPKLVHQELEKLDTTGPQGAPGVGIEKVEIIDGCLFVEYSDGLSLNVGTVLGQDGLEGEKGARGPQGDIGPQGLPPEHRWEGTKLQFKNPDGSWGILKQLQGRAGRTIRLGAGTGNGDLLVIDQDYTSRGDQNLICNAALTVKLNFLPADNERVTIKRINGEVSINGNSRTIDGNTSVIISVKYTSLSIVFARSLNQWFIN